jgi:asparagine synthase (glutamine-hydrolysing)
VLGTALELVAPSRIIAMTFGTPGSYDFEIGRLVAKVAGVRHISYPLSSSNYSTEAFLNNCRDTDGQISYTTEAPIEIYQDFAQYGSVMLSGYVGDAIMGNKTHLKSVIDHRSIVLDDMIVKRDDPLAEYISTEVIEDGYYFESRHVTSLNLSELWFFINHFTKYSYYCVFKFREHFQYISPFIDYAFMDYFLNLPFVMRVDRALYFYWLRRYFPSLADLPCSSMRGAGLSASPCKKWVMHQWDRLLHYGFGINRSVNKIDLSRYSKQLLDLKLIPSGFLQWIFSNRRYYFLLYNLKCLEILQSAFGVEFE